MDLVTVVDPPPLGVLAGPGEHTGARGDEVLDTGTRGGSVIEDFDGETVCRQRGGDPFEPLRGGRVGERRCRYLGRHGAS